MVNVNGSKEIREMDDATKKQLQKEYEKGTKKERERKLKNHYKFLKDYIVQECKYYERAYSPDIDYFPRRELLGYIDAYYDLGLINNDEEEKIVYIVEKLYQYYQNYVTLFLSDELLKECEESNKEEEK